MVKVLAWLQEWHTENLYPIAFDAKRNQQKIYIKETNISRWVTG